MFVGLEIPLLLRILKDEIEFKELVSRVLAFDYIGALVASILFPILFVPRFRVDSHVANLRNVECRRRFVGHVAAAAADQGTNHGAARESSCS